MQKPKQAPMFREGEDLPLFSGTPQTVRLSEFAPEEVNTQQTLPGMAPTWEELGKR